MEHERWDQLTRLLADRHGRRGLVTAASILGLTALLGKETNTAAKKKKKKKKTKSVCTSDETVCPPGSKTTCCNNAWPNCCPASFADRPALCCVLPCCATIEDCPAGTFCANGCCSRGARRE